MLRYLVIAAILAVALSYFGFGYFPQIASFWIQSASSRQSTLAEVDNELSVARDLEKKLAESLDSLRTMADSERSEQAILSAIQESCRNQAVVMKSYDRTQSNSKSNSRSLAYRLVVEGDFRSLTLLVSELESMPFALSIQSLAMERTLQEQSKLRGIIVVLSGVQ